MESKRNTSSGVSKKATKKKTPNGIAKADKKKKNASKKTHSEAGTSVTSSPGKLVPKQKGTKKFHPSQQSQDTIEQVSLKFSDSEKGESFFPSYFTNEIVVIRPQKFYYNGEAANDNKFMHQINKNKEEVNQEAQEQFQGFVKTLTDGGIKVYQFECGDSKAPDAIFPDWFTTHKNENIPDGIFVLYPMRYQSRRNERNPAIINQLRKDYKHFIDLTHWEHRGEALEGKGSLVFDNKNMKVYCTLSKRSSELVLNDLISKINKISKKPYRAVTMESFVDGEPIYHTDCMCVLLDKHVVICLESITDKAIRAKVVRELTDPKLNPVHTFEILEISIEQAGKMCANMQILVDNKGTNTVMMGDQAYENLPKAVLKKIQQNYKVLHTNLFSLEYTAGGSARCMIAEKF